MVVLISFRKKTFKINYILVVIILLVSFNLYFIKVLDSNLTQNYTNSIPNTGSIVDRTSEEFENELQTEIVSWGEILTDNSNLFSLDNIISYPDDALVKVRNDNKMEFVVKRDALEFSQEINEFLSKYDVEIHKDVPYFNASIIYTPVENLDEFISESESVFGISYIEPNFYVQLDFIPDDEYYESDQWDLPLIGMESAWEYGFGSHNVLVALVDTGIDYTHPDLSENYIPLGYDWVNNDSDPMDDYFHGTHCAGTIAAVIDNEIGIAGMANVSIFAEKAFNSYGQGSNVDCGLAIKHAVDMGADIISCSWGGSQSQILQESIEYALNNDVMVIAAAGNSNNNIPHYPAAYSDVIAVSATNQDDNKASFSSFGDWVDVSAPGVDILSTVPYSFMGSYYFLASGTSMATPHVSGFAALLMSSFSDFNCSQIENLIYESVVDLGDPGFDPYFGHGRIDVSFILGPDITPPKCLNLIESANPLELGDTEIITADISDRSGVNQVVIQFEGSNHSMIHTGGNTWQYNSWTPLSTGVFNYKIFMEDVYNNWGSIIRSIQVKVDATPPSYKNLIESADPLELGNSEIISIEVSDLSGVNQVVIQFEGSNHSMIYTGGNTWQYDSWIPLGIGIYPYIIYMVDNHNNWGSVTGSIQVKEDATPPSYLDIYESADPLKLGNTEIIAIEVFDSSGINQVLIQYEESNHSMIKISGNWWQYYSWVPSNVGNYIYTIFMEDNYDNWESVSGSIEVIEGGPDLIPPTYSNLTESADPLELGNSEIISIEVSDFSGVNQVIIQFEGSNHSMIHTEGNTWQYDSWTPSSIGVYPYIIYMEDNHNNWGSTTGSIQVKEDATPPSYSNLYESADPLELGKTEVISIEVFDLSGVNQVMIQFEGSNHSMMHIGSNIWQYDSWTPSSIGIYSYIIFMVDNYNNCRLISESIQVKEDVTPPTYSNINESADPLERGNTEIISIEASDLSGVNQVMIQFEGSNHSMINIGGNIWQYDSWIPLNMDINLYTIYMVDNYNNWESVSGSIQVIDTTPPSYSDLYESADPLELGNTELLSIVVSDLSGVKQVIIHFEEFDHPMTYRGINIWEYDSWTPSGIGIYPYTIYMMDNYDNWESVSGSIQVIDATPPSYSDLYESADPLELGNSEIISIEVSDFSGVNQVIIQFEGSNHSMIQTGGNQWQYDSWIPLNTDIYPYTIYMVDIYNNWGLVTGSIQVVDTTPPTCTLLTNHTEPLELGNSTAILIKATDISGIKQVLFQYDGFNYPMRDIGGDIWQFKQFSPSNVGFCNFRIYIEDFNNNWELFSSSVEIIDSQAPDPPKLIRFPSGNVSKQIVFDWEDGYDPSGIKFYRLIIDTELNPYFTPGFIFEVNITNSGSESSYFELNKPLSQGQYFFFIYQIDGVGHQSSPATGIFIVISPNTKNLNPDFMENILFILVGIIVASVVGTSGYVAVKKLKSEKKVKPLKKKFELKNYNIHIKKLRDKRLDLEREAKKFVKNGNYARASALYQQCKNISNDLFKFGIISEAEKAKYYANKGFKIFQIQEKEISFIRTNINAFLTEYYNKLGINYYSNPEIYPESQNAINGLILNDAKFLHQILLHPKKGFKLTEELNISPQILTNFKGFQFIYTNDLSQQTISDYCVKYYNPEMLLLIVSVKDDHQINFELNDYLPQEKDHRDTVKCISYKSFANILGLTGRNRNDFLTIFNFSKDFNSNTIIYHDTKELKEILKQKKFYLFL